MKNYSFGGAVSDQPIKSTTLVAAAPAATIAIYDVRQFSKLTASIGVDIAALTSLSVYVRGDQNAQWFPISRVELLAYGCSDNSTDIGRTAAGQSAMVTLDTTYLSEVRIDAASAGAAITKATGGVE